MLSFKNYRAILSTALLIFTSSVIFQLPLYADEPQPLSAADYRSKGYAQQQKGNLNEAFSYYTKALSLDPLNTEILNDLGIVYEQAKFLIKAEEFYRQAIKVDERYLPSYQNLAYLYLHTGEKENAFLYFKKRFEMGGPEDEWTQKAKEELLKLHPEYKDWARSLEAQWMEDKLVSQTLDGFDSKVLDAKTYYQKGLEYIKAGNLQMALSEIEKYLALIPNDYRALEIKDRLTLELTKQEIRQRSDEAINNLDKGDTDAARAQIEQMLALGMSASADAPKSDGVDQALDTLETKKAGQKEGLSSVDSYPQWERDVAQYHFNKGNEYFEKKNYTMAMAEYDRAIKMTPTDLNISQARQKAEQFLSESKNN